MASYTAALAIPVVLSSLVPPSGSRILLSSRGGPAFPDMGRARGPPFTDLDKLPVFIGSAFLQHSVYPCKIALKKIIGSATCHPPGRYPVKGGFESDGKELYHAVAFIEGIEVPGRTGLHLSPYGGREHVVGNNYRILCWKF
ncbi:hypothetical protein BC827DRAFT_1255302 [Russula dissimulans]|nr:hypothetical protein BC827DRAFT_1255302 [Russula dissimulans]